MNSPALPVRSRSQAAFTMVEIAISLAVIAFALVAIIGVLPSGMTVQRENREETIINQDATVFLNAIRNGAQGVDHLTNYVYAIVNHWTDYQIDSSSPQNITTNQLGAGFDYYYDTNSDVNSLSPKPFMPLTNGQRIIGLMSRPKYELNPPTGFPNFMRSNFVVAYARAQSGVASEKPPQANADVKADAFSYRIICDNQRVQVYADPLTPPNATNPAPQLAYNLRDLRLTFRWPLNAKGEAGNGRQTFRLEVGGNLADGPIGTGTTNDPWSNPRHPLWFFNPSTFAKANP